MPYDFTHIRNLRNQTKKKQTNKKNRLLTIENKLMVIRGEVSRGIDEIDEGN